MRVFYGFDGTSQIEKAVCTVGSYDGVHIGHQRLIEECREQAKAIGGESVVLTFEPHPRIVLGRAEGLKLLTTLPEKIELLSGAGVDNLIVIPFDEEFSRVKYSDFVEQYLIAKVGMQCMIVGYNHLFGHKNEGNYTLLSELSERLGFRVVELAEQRCDSQKVSSTVIRRAIESGDVESAVEQLGHPYLVLKGDSEWKLLPPEGRYVARVEGEVIEIDITHKGAEYSRVEILKSVKLC
ncbi:MAG: FAD synthetase family protein [Rikenellaceae bacterium]